MFVFLPLSLSKLRIFLLTKRYFCVRIKKIEILFHFIFSQFFAFLGKLSFLTVSKSKLSISTKQGDFYEFLRIESRTKRIF